MQRRFTINGVHRMREDFVVDQPRDPVTSGVNRTARDVLEHSSLEIIGHADIEAAGFAGEDIDVELAHARSYGESKLAAQPDGCAASRKYCEIQEQALAAARRRATVRAPLA
jgi:hypothetical protein